MLSLDSQQTFIANALTCLDEARDPEQLAFAPEWITRSNVHRSRQVAIKAASE